MSDAGTTQADPTVDPAADPALDPGGDPAAGDRARERLAAVRAEVGKAVVGQDAAVSGLLVALLCAGSRAPGGRARGRQDPPGPHAGRRALGRHRRVQFTPDLMPGDITGSLVIDSNRGELSFREGPLFTNLLLADEINRTPPKTQSALLEAMEERHVSVDGVSRALPTPFLVAATQNPVEYEGTYPLPEAQLDRFLLKVVLPLPERAAEMEILRRHANGFDPRDLAAAGVSPVAGPADARRRAGRRRPGPGLPGGRRLHRRHRPGHPAVALAQPGCQPARGDRPAARRPGLGLADRTRLRDPRRRQGAGARDPGPPARAATRGRARGRRRRAGPRQRPRVRAGAPMTPTGRR